MVSLAIKRGAAMALLIPSIVGSETVAETRLPPGPVTREQLAASAGWFATGYAAYAPDSAPIAAVRSAAAGPAIIIEAYFGVWCGDSRRQIPRFVKVLDAAGLPPQALRLVALSDRAGEYKQSPGRPERERRVFRTPTIIVFRNGKELGRIIETPYGSMEADLAAIVAGRPEPGRYGAEAWIHDSFIDLGAAEFDRALASADAVVSSLSAPDSLWHYAEHDLLKNDEPRAAKAVLELHLRLEPRSARGFALLGEANLALGDVEGARVAARAALAIDAGNDRARRVLLKAGEQQTPPANRD